MDNKDLNAELSSLGLNTISDTDPTPERTAYLAHFNVEPNTDEEAKEWAKRLKALKTAHTQAFYKYFAHVYPHLRYEVGEDKTYWLYNTETGIYEELNFTTVRGLIIKLMIADGLEAQATEAQAKTCLHRFRANSTERASAYEDFDAEQDYFHAANGWVNINSREFTPHTPARLSRRVSSVAYVPDAVCPIYDRFLDEQIQLQKDQVRALDQFSGLLLTPDITKQKMLVLIGKPGSGKSTLLDCWSDVLGDVATQRSLNDISSDSFRFGGASLVGKRLCWFDEVEVTRTNMGNSLINLITGQYINVERKGINGIIEAPNQIKCVLTANTLPRSAEMGIYRRMILIYFEHSFYDSMTADQEIRTKLRAEASGILNRMLNGLADLQKHRGFTTIEGHDDLIEDYKSSSNTVAEFLTTHFEFDYDADKIPTKTLLNTYKKFCDDRYAQGLTPHRFSVLLKTHGLAEFDKIYMARGTKGTRMWCGLKLREEFKIEGEVILENVDF